MNATLPSGILVSALLKRVNDAGGMGMVRAKGDPDSGAILLILNGDSGSARLLERGLDPAGKAALLPVGTDGSTDSATTEGYWRRRRARDPDLWVIELDIPSAERFAAETILGN